MRRASRVIVPSQATRDELVRLLDADPTRIDVAHHGVDTATFRPPSETETRRVNDRLGLHGKPYVAFLGVLERRKNVPDLVRGWVTAVAGPATTRRRWCSPAAAAGTTTSTRRSPRCRPT